jgi:hypothetical protein
MIKTMPDKIFSAATYCTSGALFVQALRGPMTGFTVWTGILLR